jgi:hypothetical protein
MAGSVAIVFEQTYASMEGSIICSGNGGPKSAIIQTKFGISQEFSGYP